MRVSRKCRSGMLGDASTRLFAMARGAYKSADLRSPVRMVRGTPRGASGWARCLLSATLSACLRDVVQMPRGVRRTFLERRAHPGESARHRDTRRTRELLRGTRASRPVTRRDGSPGVHGRALRYPHGLGQHLRLDVALRRPHGCVVTESAAVGLEPRHLGPGGSQAQIFDRNMVWPIHLGVPDRPRGFRQRTGDQDYGRAAVKSRRRSRPAWVAASCAR